MITLNPVEIRPVAPEPSTAAAAPAPTTALAPVPPRAAVAILGTMILLILMLAAILVETTWVNPAGAPEVPAAEAGSLAQR